MVLLHHPDKKADKNDDAFFKCIAKAFDTLMNPVTRRQYDSVDFGMAWLEEDAPTAKSKGDFYELWRPVFEREGRFSTKQPVPSLAMPTPPKKTWRPFTTFSTTLIPGEPLSGSIKKVLRALTTVTTSVTKKRRTVLSVLNSRRKTMPVSVLLSTPV